MPAGWATGSHQVALGQVCSGLSQAFAQVGVLSETVGHLGQLASYWTRRPTWSWAVNLRPVPGPDLISTVAKYFPLPTGIGSDATSKTSSPTRKTVVDRTVSAASRNCPGPARTASTGVCSPFSPMTNPKMARKPLPLGTWGKFRTYITHTNEKGKADGYRSTAYFRDFDGRTRQVDAYGCQRRLKMNPFAAVESEPLAGCHGWSSVGVGIRPRLWFLRR